MRSYQVAFPIHYLRKLGQNQIVLLVYDLGYNMGLKRWKVLHYVFEILIGSKSLNFKEEKKFAVNFNLILFYAFGFMTLFDQDLFKILSHSFCNNYCVKYIYCICMLNLHRTFCFVRLPSTKMKKIIKSIKTI